MSNIDFIFFGSSPISITALNELERVGLIPKMVLTQPDRPQGRGLAVLPSPVKVWAQSRGIEVMTSLEADKLTNKASVGVLVSYGKLIPKRIIDLFPKGIINLHPSLLPKLRGPSPIESSILMDMKDGAGVSIMLLTEKMDEGPILAQRKVEVNSPTDGWPMKRGELYDILSVEGAKLLTETLPLWVEGRIEPKTQDDSEATYSKIIVKSDGEIDMSDDPYQNFLKIRAFDGWPDTYFYINHAGKPMRVKVTDASYHEGQLKITRVIPEGKKEISFEDFKKGYQINP